MKFLRLSRRPTPADLPMPVIMDVLSAAQQAQFNYALLHSADLERQRRAIDQR
jgi:hypothetical protein